MMKTASSAHMSFNVLDISQYLATHISQMAQKPSLFIKAFVGYIYFIQGVYGALLGLIVYLFPVFPKPDVLSSFSLAALPFSFKFLTAPIVQKFTVRRYGRRKFWILLSLLVTSILTYPLAFIADNQQEYKLTIGLLFVIFVFISMGDVGIDAAAVVELDDPVLAGYLQAGIQPLGSIVGSFLILNSNKTQFWTFIGIEGALCTTKTLLLGLSVMGLVITVILHFFYKQKVSQEQQQEQLPKIKTIAQYYLHFINPKYTVCRHVLYFVLVMQGLKCFKLNFAVEAIHRGFPKERVADLENMCIVIGIVTNTILSRFITKENIYTSLTYFYFIELLLYTAIYFSDSFHQQIVLLTICFVQIVAYIRFLMNSSLINSFGNSQFAGLCLTILASFVNLGNNSWLQLKLNSEFGYSSVVLGGLGYAWALGLFLKPFTGWVRQGEAQCRIQESHQKQN